ncbi:hypothetical protein BKA61DRAFT_729808 [Leptodontidium sp. MPI-SDFR-AT-0119]|nr:hypothetical protein BKA61DRAFT_729808 [Leptodontidium sp. MPI-SDFR-AT-0119]
MSSQPSLPAQTGNGKTILITGGSGYVAAHVLNSFLSRGYNVRTTVRSQAAAERVKKSHTQYLDQLSFAIVEEIAAPGAHDEAVKGVDGVVHTASPFKLQVTSNKNDLLDPAINGTLSLLTSIQTHNPLVTHVVITSSFASILDLSLGARPGYTYTEKDWNPITYDAAADASTPGAVAYCASKALAERAAFEYVATQEEKVKPNFHITTLCPPMVYGPAIENSIESLDLGKMNTSSADIYRLVNGSEKDVPETAFFAFVDVRDLGEAHVKAYERGLEGEKRGKAERYLVASGVYTYQQVCDVVREDFPKRRGLVPEARKGGETESENEGEFYGVDNGKVRRELGVEFRGLRECIGDMVREFEVVEKRLGVAV